MRNNLEGNLAGKWENALNIDDSENMAPGPVSLSMLWNYIHVYVHNIQIYIIGVYTRSQMSVYRTIGPLTDCVYSTWI